MKIRIRIRIAEANLRLDTTRDFVDIIVFQNIANTCDLTGTGSGSVDPERCC